MGVFNLSKILQRTCGEYNVDVSFSEFSGHRIAVDIMSFLYRYVYGAVKSIILKTSINIDDIRTCIQDGNDICDILCDSKRLMQEFCMFFIRLLHAAVKEQVTLVFVFDGISPIEKSSVKHNRKQKETDMREQIDSIYAEIALMLNDECSERHIMKTVNNYRAKLPSAIKPTALHIGAVKTSLHILNVPIIQALSEGEGLCALLCQQGHVVAAMSPDTDLYAYGCPLIISSVSIRKGGTTSILTCSLMSQILERTDLTQKEFTDMCILCGCDFNHYYHPTGVGFAKAIELIQKYRSCKRIEKHTNYDLGPTNYKRCREIYTQISDDVDISKLNYTYIQLKPTQRKILMDHMTGTPSFKNKYIDAIVVYINRICGDKINVDIPKIEDDETILDVY